ncbi:hypothetical protein FOL47_003346 [Perkinsus chesapeaki]|uniref:L-type lectin-like domain-containing protein n=1 Tax=Perkinsus chesapeaki TaxID=330153 RepID=A0A7J6M902_PERCH|nr:hypothetical protein FOL47_003346 [Perkinsus chesapeaki]
MPNPRLLLVAPLLLILSAPVHGQVQLQSHSFNQAVDQRLFNERWNTMGTCVSEGDYVPLVPRVPDRFGAMWHRSPLRTDNFEATFTLDLKNPPDGSDPKHEQGFAFWYVYDDPSTQYPREVLSCRDHCVEDLEKAGLGLMGYKSNFNGLAIFFPNNRFVDGRMELQPSASLAMDDGSLIYNRQVDLPTGYGSFWDYRNRRLTIQIRVQPESVNVQGRFADADPWTPLINYQITDPKFRIRPNGYIGITSMVVPVGGQIINHVDQVNLNTLTVVNYDPGQRGEDPESVPEAFDFNARPDPILERALDGTPERMASSLNDLKLTAYKIITELEPLRWRTEQGMKELQARTETLKQTLDRLQRDIEVSGNVDMAEQFRNMKQDLMDISREAADSRRGRQRDLDMLEEGLATMNSNPGSSSLAEVQRKAQKMKDELRSSGNTLLWLAVACLIAIISVGVAVYRKFRHLEKSHLL